MLNYQYYQYPTYINPNFNPCLNSHLVVQTIYQSNPACEYSSRFNNSNFRMCSNHILGNLLTGSSSSQDLANTRLSLVNYISYNFNYQGTYCVDLATTSLKLDEIYSTYLNKIYENAIQIKNPFARNSYLNKQIGYFSVLTANFGEDFFHPINSANQLIFGANDFSYKSKENYRKILSLLPEIVRIECSNLSSTDHHSSSFFGQFNNSRRVNDVQDSLSKTTLDKSSTLTAMQASDLNEETREERKKVKFCQTVDVRVIRNGMQRDVSVNSKHEDPAEISTEEQNHVVFSTEAYRRSLGCNGNREVPEGYIKRNGKLLHRRERTIVSFLNDPDQKPQEPVKPKKFEPSLDSIPEDEEDPIQRIKNQTENKSARLMPLEIDGNQTCSPSKKEPSSSPKLCGIDNESDLGICNKSMVRNAFTFWLLRQEKSSTSRTID
jgi:hypothetical protein